MEEQAHAVCSPLPKLAPPTTITTVPYREGRLRGLLMSITSTEPMLTEIQPEMGQAAMH